MWQASKRDSSMKFDFWFSKFFLTAFYCASNGFPSTLPSIEDIDRNLFALWMLSFHAFEWELRSLLVYSAFRFYNSSQLRYLEKLVLNLGIVLVRGSFGPPISFDTSWSLTFTKLVPSVPDTALETLARKLYLLFTAWSGGENSSSALMLLSLSISDIFCW